MAAVCIAEWLWCCSGHCSKMQAAVCASQALEAVSMYRLWLVLGAGEGCKQLRMAVSA